MAKSTITFEGEAKILPKEGLEGFCLVDEDGKESSFDKIAEKVYYSHGNNYSLNTVIKYKIIVDKANK